MNSVSDLASVNPSFECILERVVKRTRLKARQVKLRGTQIQIPSRTLFITEDGSVYVLVKRCGGKVEYASLNSLIDTVKNTVVITNEAGPIPESK